MRFYIGHLHVTMWEVEPWQKCGEHPALCGWVGAVWGGTLPAAHLRPLTWIKQKKIWCLSGISALHISENQKTFPENTPKNVTRASVM